MESLPFVVPIAAAVFLANACWSFSLGCQVRHLRRRVEAVEDAQVYASRQQQQTQQRPSPVVVPIPTPTATAPVYYPGPMYQQPHPNSQPPPYRPLASAPPSSSFQHV